MLTRSVVLMAGLAVAVVAVVVWQARHRWNAATAELTKRLRSSASASTAAVYSEADLVGLPPPVARYLRAALPDGQPIVRRARITWRGEFNIAKPPGSDWKPFLATQEFAPRGPGFVWDARIAMAPGLPMMVRDAFVEGEGSMYGAMLGLVKVVDVRGTETIAAGALQRYLGEAAWLPTALLPSQGVSWTAIDERRARATVTGGGTTVSLEFRFGQDGLVASVFAPDRVYDDGKSPPVPRPWTARNLRFERRHGMMVAAEAEVAWDLPSGPFAYWRGRPEQIELEYETSK